MIEQFHATCRLRSRKAPVSLTGAILALALAGATTLAGQQVPSPKPQAPPTPTAPGDKNDGETRITPGQAKELFALVDQLMKFSSDETGLPIKSSVKRQLTSRGEVERYLKEKFDEDESNRRLQRGEIVLKNS